MVGTPRSFWKGSPVTGRQQSAPAESVILAAWSDKVVKLEKLFPAKPHFSIFKGHCCLVWHEAPVESK